MSQLSRENSIRLSRHLKELERERRHSTPGKIARAFNLSDATHERMNGVQQQKGPAPNRLFGDCQVSAACSLGTDVHRG